MEREITVIQDTREQLPLEFTLPVRIEKLDVGDYAAEIDGTRLPIIFERKSINDLWGSLTQGYERFRREIIRAESLKVVLVIIVEASLTEISEGITYSDRLPSSILAQIFYIGVKYHVQTVFCNNRDEAVSYIEQSFIAHAKYYINAKGGKT